MLITKHLVESISGMLVGEASKSPSRERMKTQKMDMTGFARGQGEVIVLRTNYPHHPTGKLALWDYFVLRAFVVLRNPLTAIPSYFDHLYQMNSHVPAGDSSSETIAAWIKYRDNQFSDQLYLWERLVSFWMDKYEDEKRMFFSYERLVDEESGVHEIKELAQFLEKGCKERAIELSKNDVGQTQDLIVADAVKSFAHPDELFCIWKEFVGMAAPDIEDGQRSWSPNKRPFTAENITAIRKMLLELINRWSHHQRLVSILTGYYQETQVIENGRYTG